MGITLGEDILLNYIPPLVYSVAEVSRVLEFKDGVFFPEAVAHEYSHLLMGLWARKHAAVETIFTVFPREKERQTVLGMNYPLLLQVTSIRTCCGRSV